ncbi:MAG: hypothetical protein PQJ46_05785 [Spirochaetales bacterium]|nr:hypothetical protein [Spirochaetales bacterium]
MNKLRVIAFTLSILFLFVSCQNGAWGKTVEFNVKNASSCDICDIKIYSGKNKELSLSTGDLTSGKSNSVTLYMSDKAELSDSFVVHCELGSQSFIAKLKYEEENFSRKDYVNVIITDYGIFEDSDK